MFDIFDFLYRQNTVAYIFGPFVQNVAGHLRQVGVRYLILEYVPSLNILSYTVYYFSILTSMPYMQLSAVARLLYNVFCSILHTTLH